LAKAGHKVTVLEARDSVGGCVSMREFSKGFKVAGLAHVLPTLNAAISKDLGLKAAGLSPSAGVDTIALDKKGQHLTLGADSVTGKTLSTDDAKAYTGFKKEFKSYANALEPMTMNKPPRLKDMDIQDKFTLAKLGWKLRFGLGAASMSEFLRVGGINIYDVLNEVFENEHLKGAIAADAVIGHHMGPRTPTTVLTYLHRCRGELYGPQTVSISGEGGVVNALVAAATKAGVDIKTNMAVQKINVVDGRATGVVLSSGESLEADTVVSNADAKTTFLELVGTQELDAMFAHRISTTRTNGTVAKLHIALKKLPSFKGLTEKQLGQRLLIAPNMRYVEHAFNHAKYGEYSKAPVLEMTIPSLCDPLLAPKGQHVMSVSASFAPYALKEGWDNAASAFTNKILAIIEEYAPGFSDHIIASELLTPEDIESEFNVTGGHWHHGELTIDQSFMMRPIHGTAQYDTPIDGLFLCGAAAHPGGGVTGTPGHNAAKRILSMPKKILTMKAGN
jgi:phytoene dehydrogenase-like protein